MQLNSVNLKKYCHYRITICKEYDILDDTVDLQQVQRVISNPNKTIFVRIHTILSKRLEYAVYFCNPTASSVTGYFTKEEMKSINDAYRDLIEKDVNFLNLDSYQMYLDIISALVTKRHADVSKNVSFREGLV